MFSGDDIMYPGKIEHQMNDVLCYDLSFHGHAVNCIDELGLVFDEIRPCGEGLIIGNRSLIVKGIGAAGCSWIIEKSRAQLNKKVGFLHDFDMVIRVLRNERIGYISNEKLGAYRITKSSWSRNLSLKAYVKAYVNLTNSWIKSGMYSECLWLAIRLFLRIPKLTIKFSRAHKK